MSHETETLGMLLLSASEEEARRLRALLPGELCTPVLYARSAQDALRLAERSDVELAVVCEPVAGENAQALVPSLLAQDRICMLLLAASDAPRPALEAQGVLVLPRSAPDALIRQAIRLLTATRFRLRRLEHQTAKLEARVEDLRVVNRAKLLLVQHLKMTENEAHRYIEKQAMDTGMKRRSIAENIIRTYEA